MNRRLIYFLSGLPLMWLWGTTPTPGQLRERLEFDAPAISINQAGLSEISLPGCQMAVRPGLPVLPVTGLSFEIPQGFEVASIEVTPLQVKEYQLSAPVVWGNYPSHPGATPRPAEPDAATYGASTPYPDSMAPQWRVDQCGGASLLSVQVFPIRYIPADNRLLAALNLDVAVVLRPAAPAPPSPRPALFDMTPSLDPATPYSYIVISTTNLISNTPAPWNLQALRDHRAASGLVPLIISVEEINETYPGGDTPERVRSFLRNAYAAWRTRYLLIAGTFEMIPARKLRVAVKDFIFTNTADIPSDTIYYGCMDGEFDYNNNGLYGELTDGDNGGDVDLTAEIMVGRFPVATPQELGHMIRKTLRYEGASPADFAPHAFMAEKVDMGRIVYADGYLEELRLGALAYNFDSMGFENSPYSNSFDTSYQLYDSESGLWSAGDALAFLNRDLHTVSHLGHGTTTICMKIQASNATHRQALNAFTNEMPYFIYSQACNSGAFDRTNNFAQAITTCSNAAFATVMNAREGWLYNDVVGGYSHSYNRAFWDAALRGKATTLGGINEMSRRHNLHMVSSYAPDYWRWVYYGLNLFGDPATTFAPAINRTLPEIAHEPLLNTYNTALPYHIAARITPAGLYDPQTINLTWFSSDAPGTLYTQQMERVIGNHYATEIPPHPIHTIITYSIQVETHAGRQIAHPATGEHSFHVTPRHTLLIHGVPDAFGAPSPDYGAYHFASGLTAVASAPAIVQLTEDTRVKGAGYYGSGSPPPLGSEQEVEFMIRGDSRIHWRWEHENRLLVENRADAGQRHVLWGKYDSFVDAPTAPEVVTLSNGAVMMFAEWRCDNQRYPPLPEPSLPDPGAVRMDAPHTLEARYRPRDLDEDGNTIPDWWEVRYFGANAQDPLADDDCDGFTLAEEYGDRTNPLDPLSTPSPPEIAHTPLAETLPRPGPFEIEARISDTHEISSAVVSWRQGPGEWRETPMSPANIATNYLTIPTNHQYYAEIGAALTAGDDLEYRIIASDSGGRVAQTPIHYAFLVFPIADTSRFHDLLHCALPTQTMITSAMNLHNTGNADLLWSTRFARVDQIRDTALRTWDRTSLEQPWQVSTNRFASPPYALRAQPLSSGLTTGAAVRATISMPLLRVGAEAKLSFSHWIFSEVRLDTTNAFDGGLVEFSRDRGETFQQLKGPYTHAIYGWAHSPWPHGTPCFAGKGTDEWSRVVFDLASEYPEYNGFKGEELVFRFHYGGDNNTDNEGWYIDDIEVSPLMEPPGFYNDLEPHYDYTITPGLNKRINWFNHPINMLKHDDYVTVYLDSNDPVTPSFGFHWEVRIRDYPLIENLTARQSAKGDGLVSVSGQFADADGEPLDLTFAWSDNGGGEWHSAALTNLADTTGALWTNDTNSALAGVPTSFNDLPLTNTVTGVWSTRLAEPTLAFSTQTLFRVTASNTCFGAIATTPYFTVDNVPPVFSAGSITFSPYNQRYGYAVTRGPLTLQWPAATDEPLNHIFYALHNQSQSQEVDQTTATLPMAETLDTTNHFQVVAYDPFGNRSAPITASLLVLSPDTDYDGDGMITSDEEIAGVSAADADSRFAIADFSADAGSGPRMLRWWSAEGRLYTVEYSESLDNPYWQPVEGFESLPGTGEFVDVTLPRDLPTCFFRLRVHLP